MYCTCIFNKGPFFLLDDGSALEKTKLSKLILSQWLHLINETTQCTWEFPGSQYSFQKYMFSHYYLQVWGHENVVLIKHSTKVMGFISGDAIVIKVGKQLDVCWAGLTRPYIGPAFTRSLFVYKLCFTGRLKRAPAKAIWQLSDW